MPSVKRINHIAILVDDLEETLSFWENGLGIQMSHQEEVSSEKSVVAFLPIGDSEVELVKPTADDSGLMRFLEKRGPGMHHICLEVEDISGMMQHLKSIGVQLINEVPLEGSGGKRYAFIHPKSANGVMIELYEITQ